MEGFKEFVLTDGVWFGNDSAVTKFRRQKKDSDAGPAFEKSKGGTTKYITPPKKPEPNQG